VPDNRTLEVGDSFTFRDQNGIHLHVIVAESSGEDSATIMLVYLSSADVPYRDTTVIIKKGEHPFVDRESWVRYQNVIVCSREEIELIVEHFGKVDTHLLERIQAGIEESEYVPKWIKNLFRQWKEDKIFRDLKHKK
jgi:hypothetical protein